MMGTYVAMLSWSGPAPADVRRAIRKHATQLHTRGLHSVAFLPDEGDCAAVMICAAPDDESVVELAYSILPHEVLSVETMRFDDSPGGDLPGLGEVVHPPPPRDYLGDPLDRIYAA